jgi:hypothetical protein
MLEDAQGILLTHGNFFQEQITLHKVSQRTEYGSARWHPEPVLILCDLSRSPSCRTICKTGASKALGVTREELEQAVKKAGNSAEAVRQHLRTRH